MKTQKRLAASVLKTSPYKIKFSQSRLADIKEAITKSDIRMLVSEKAIKKDAVKGISRVRANKLKVQKSKDLRKGPGSREGKKTARLSKKKNWMNKVRSQRKLLAELKEKSKISNATYRELYYKSKGGYFRSRRHILLHLTEKELFVGGSDK